MDEKISALSGAPTLDNTLEQKASSALPRVRTYAKDMSSAIKQRGDTLASIVNKEHTAPKKQTRGEEKPRTLRGTFILILTILAFTSGVGTLATVFFLKSAPPSSINEARIIFANHEVRVPLDASASPITALAKARAEQNFSLGEIAHIVVTKNDTPLTPRELALALGVPTTLAREVTDAMIGIHAFEKNQPFIIFTVSAYDRSFAAMLSWEKEMGRALGAFFAPGITAQGAPTLTFSDTIIQNLDARTSTSSWPILYTFPVQKTLIITTNEFTLREILTRLNSSTGNIPY